VHVAIHDAFIVKYASSSTVMDRKDEDTEMGLSGNHRCQGSVIGESASQVFLPLHTDQSSHSFIIPLNASSEYTGGGTYFPSLDCILRPGVGQALFFPGGSILHGGQPITAGTRYILAVFVYMSSSIGGMTSDASAAMTCQSEFDRECGLSSAADVRMADDLHATTRFIPLPHDTCTTEGSHRRAKRPRVSLAHDAAQEDHSNEPPWIERSRVDTCLLTNIRSSLDDGRSTFTFGFNVPP
jgi:hypothetical protein